MTKCAMRAGRHWGGGSCPRRRFLPRRCAGISSLPPRLLSNADRLHGLARLADNLCEDLARQVRSAGAAKLVAVALGLSAVWAFEAG